jgi:hypothetical protein
VFEYSWLLKSQLPSVSLLHDPLLARLLSEVLRPRPFLPDW